MALVVSEIPALNDDDAIERFTRSNPGWRIEFTQTGSLVVSPTFSDGGARDLEAAAQLRDFAKRVGGKAFSSSAGFRIPVAGLKSPDASWISQEHLNGLAPETKRKFWATCPDIVIELLSETDSWAELQDKIRLYYGSGAQYALGIDPYRRDTFALGTPPESLQLDLDAIIDA